MNSDDLRVLSIRQPWTELILAGVKPVENRSWPTVWRGLVVLHAGLRWDPAGVEPAAAHGIPRDRTLPTGYLGVAELVDVHRDAGCCRPWGQPEAFHWQFRPVHRFPRPIAAAGRLGLHRPASPWLPVLHNLIAELTDLTRPDGGGEND